MLWEYRGRGGEGGVGERLLKCWCCVTMTVQRQSYLHHVSLPSPTAAAAAGQRLTGFSLLWNSDDLLPKEQQPGKNYGTFCFYTPSFISTSGIRH